MASLAQFKNRVKVIVVGRISAEFRKSAIVEKIIERAKANDHVATGKLTNPKKSRSIIPFSDDRWLVRKDAVRIDAVELPSGQYMVSNVRLNIKFGVNYRYSQLAHYTPKKKGQAVPVSAIRKWMDRKIARGHTFKDSRGVAIPAGSKKLNGVAWAIAQSIKRNGINKSDFTKPFYDRKNGVRPTVNRAMRKVATRLNALYATSIEKSVANILNRNF